jgi:hypothetical protein
MIRVTIGEHCRDLMNMLEISDSQVETTINNRHRGLIDNGATRIAAVHWFSDESIVLVESVVKDRDIDGNMVKFKMVEASLVIEIAPTLPMGAVSKEMRMEPILEVVAKSFGHPVTCHPSHLPVPLYTGPWDGQTISAGIGTLKGWHHVCGSFSPRNQTAELVWMFDMDRYRRWFRGE